MTPKTDSYQNLRRRRRYIPVSEEAVAPRPPIPPTPGEVAEGEISSPSTQSAPAETPTVARHKAPLDTTAKLTTAEVVAESVSKSVEIVAELSANHGQNLDLAFQTMRAIAAAGATAIKLQSYDAQSLTLPLEQPPFIISGSSSDSTPREATPWDGRSLYSLYEEAAMPWAWHKPLYKLAAQLGLEIFSTPFCLRGVDFLEQLETPRYKIASFEIGHLELVRRVAATGKPIIVSLGLADFHDIERFLETCEQEGNRDITLLQCTSAYPASPAAANLAMLPHLKSTFGCRVGLSDHSMGFTVAVAAVALGAELIEKHVILARSMGGPDASFSLEPAEFAALVDEIRTAAAAIGRVNYRRHKSERTARQFGRAIFVLRDIKVNEHLRREDIAVLRPFPSGAIEPHHLEHLLGAKVRCAVPYGTALRWHMLEMET